jgi:histidinol-phosphatase
MADPSFQDLLAAATEAAYIGGRRTLAYFNTPLTIETKADETPVTCADRECEQIIRDYITRRFPTHGILGEEAGATVGGDSRYRWIIDPIDGTKTFCQGVPLYGVMIGIEVDGRPRVGVIYLPALDEIVCAAEGFGCWWNGRRSAVSRTRDLAKAVLLTSDATMCDARSNVHRELARRTRVQRTWGDCYGYVLVATGRADVMIDPRLSPWDAAPLIPILHEAGGRFSSWKGEATIHGEDGVGSNGLLHDAVLEVIRGHDN